jgi:hypothetical protein
MSNFKMFRLFNYKRKQKRKKIERRKPEKKMAQRAGPLVDWVLLPCAEPQIESAVGAK